MGQAAFGGLDAGAHPFERLRDPPHRPLRERRVARELELLADLTREDAGEQPDERARVRAVDRPPGAFRPPRPFPKTRSVSAPCSYTSTPSARTAAIVASVSAERPKPEIRVSPSQIAPISTDAVRDRLVAGHRDVPHEPRHRLDEERLSPDGHAPTPVLAGHVRHGRLDKNRCLAPILSTDHLRRPKAPEHADSRFLRRRGFSTALSTGLAHSSITGAATTP